MLCQVCEKALQAAAFRVRVGRDGRPEPISEPSHLSIHSFYESILAGCTICRWMWANILQRRTYRYHGNHDQQAIYLEDPAHSISSNLEEFQITLNEWVRNRVAENRLLRSPEESGCAEPTLSCKEIEFERSGGLLEGCKLDIIACKIMDQEVRYLVDTKFQELQLSGHLHIYPVAPTALEIIDTLNRSLKPTHISTGEASHLWRFWSTTCRESHTECQIAERRLQPLRPTRLIQVLRDNQKGIDTWNLSCRRTENLDDAVSIVPYLTLSHCWGSTHPIQLTKSNLLDFLRPSRFSMLPKTYQHALEVTRSLGYEYIWIDSLCILQDDNKDWERESALMGQIYGYGACKIAATWAIDSKDGCFSNSDPAARSPNYISLQPFGQESPTQYQIGQPSTYDVDINKAPLNKRAWVIQERYLPRRQLNFAKRQTYWECRQLLASEEFPTGILHPSKLSKPRTNLKKRLHRRQAWIELVELYSRCGLTRKSHKLVALHGSARYRTSQMINTFQGFGERTYINSCIGSLLETR